MKQYLLDTHVWYWLLESNRKLSRSITLHLENTSVDNVFLSPISILEIGILQRKGKVSLASGFELWLERTRQRFAICEIPVTSEIAARAYYLPLDHNDPANRLIAATAVEYGLTLLTQDRQLIGHDWLKTVS